MLCKEYVNEWKSGFVSEPAHNGKFAFRVVPVVELDKSRTRKKKSPRPDINPQERERTG